MKLAVQLPLLPHVRGLNNPCHLAQSQKGLAEGPHKGGALHLCDMVRVDDHVDVYTFDDNGPIAANANDVTEAFGGWVAPG